MSLRITEVFYIILPFREENYMFGFKFLLFSIPEILGCFLLYTLIFSNHLTPRSDYQLNQDPQRTNL